MELKDAYKKAFAEAFESLKDEGLIELKETAEMVGVKAANKIVDAIETGARTSTTPYDDFALAVTPMIRKALIEDLVDRIDGEDDQQV